MNPLDYIAQIFWSFFGIFMLFAKSLFKPSDPNAVMSRGNGRGGGGGGGGPGGPRIHRIQAPMNVRGGG